jgi:PleD family two-component response regulator
MPHEQDQLLKSEKTRGKIILVVEDDVEIASFLSLAIGQETPYQAVVVTDGHQALETVTHVLVDLSCQRGKTPYPSGKGMKAPLLSTFSLWCKNISLVP